MSKVRVAYYGLIKAVVGKQEEECQISAETTAKQLLQTLIDIYGDEFRGKLFTPEMQILPLVVIQVDGRDIDGLDIKLKDNSELSITVIPHPVMGG